MDKTTQERICNDSAQYLKKLIAENRNPLCYAVTDYIAGATAENKRAQKVIKALDQLKEGAPNHTIIFIDKVIKKWRGTGKEVEQKCACRYPTFNAMTDRCLTCNRPYKV